MSSYDQRVVKTQGLITDARAAMSDISPELRNLNPEDFGRLSEVLDYTDEVVSRTRPTLVPDSAWDSIDVSLENLATEARNQTETFAQSRTRAWATELGREIAQFPPARGRVPEQQTTATLDRIRTEANTRIEELRAELEGLGEREAELRDSVSAQAEQLRTSIEERRREFQGAVNQLEEQLAAERARIEGATTEQAETFRESQKRMEQEFAAHEQQRRERSEATASETQQQVADLLSQIEEMRDQSAELVGAIGVTGTAERYNEEADEQRRAANNWRRLAVVFGAFAVAVALIAALTSHDTTNQALVAKLAVGIAFGGLAAYGAKQSSRHRNREEDARAIQLDLTAFNVFIEPLPEEQQTAERIALGRRLFGQRFAARGRLMESDAGPSPVEHLAEAARQFVARSDSAS